MIRLEVKDQNTGIIYELDTYGNENIALTLQVDDVRNIENRNASYSKDFNLPATKSNNKFFEHFYNVDRYAANFNVYKNLKAYLYADEILILEGFLKLTNTVDKNTEISYNVVLFNDVANIIETLADATIKDLDFTDINHKVTSINIVGSWAQTVFLTAGGTTDKVYYPLINDGSIYTDEENLYIDYKKNYVLNLSLKYVIDKIFEFAGFTYTSSFFTDDLFTSLFFDIGGEDVGSDFTDTTVRANVGSGTDSIGVNAGTNISSALADATVIDFVNESGDTDGNFNHNTSVFTAPYDCYLNINYEVAVGNTSEFQVGALQLYANDTYIGQTYINEAPSGSVTIVEHTYTGSIYVEQGNTVTFQWVAPTGDLMIYNTFVTSPTLEIQIMDISTDSKIAAKRGDIKLADILKDIFKMFNLTIESLGNNILRIETYNEFVNDKIVLDWTDKVDVNELVLEPIEIPKRVVFKHAEDSDDYYHEQYKATHLQDYGMQVVEFDVDSTEQVDIQLDVFAAPFIKELEDTNTNLQHIAKSDGETLQEFDNAPRLIIYNPNGFSTQGLVINDINEGTTIFGAGYVSTNNGTPYDGSANTEPPIPQLTANSNSLLFGFTNTIYLPTIGAIPQKTLFLEYWFDYINAKYNVTNGLLVKIEVNLKPNDVLNFNFGYIVKIQEQNYRVNKIEYNTDINSLAKVELLRI